MRARARVVFKYFSININNKLCVCIYEKEWKKTRNLYYDLSFLKFSGELGDYDPEIHEGNYISEHKLLKTQTPTIEEKAMELHQTQLKGFTPEQAENYFLRIASQLDTYAVDPHPVKVIFVIFARRPCNSEGITSLLIQKFVL